MRGIEFLGTVYKRLTLPLLNLSISSCDISKENEVLNLVNQDRGNFINET